MDTSLFTKLYHSYHTAQSHKLLKHIFFFLIKIKSNRKLIFYFAKVKETNNKSARKKNFFCGPKTLWLKNYDSNKKKKKLFCMLCLGIKVVADTF